MKTFNDLTNEMNELYRKKNSDYGNSFDISLNKYGMIAALTRMSDKFNRLETLILNKSQQVADEKIEDTLMDLASYCVMTLKWMSNDISSNK